MKNLKSEIEKILKPNNNRKCPHCSFVSKFSTNGIETHLLKIHHTPKRIDKLLSLFKQQMKEMVPKKKDGECFEPNYYEKEYKQRDEGFNSAIDQLLKNIEGL